MFGLHMIQPKISGYFHGCQSVLGDLTKGDITKKLKI